MSYAMYQLLSRAADDQQVDDDFNPYGYTISKPVAAIFVALFGLSTLVHFGQSLWSRKWYLLPSIVLGGIGEILGWSGRLWSAINIDADTPFLIQISTTIIAPTFIAAANFIILGTIISRAGPQYSRMPAKLYGWIFITIDVVALVVQAIGGGMASSASNTVDGDPEVGGHVMLVGIIVQMVEILIYSILAAEFFFNYAKKRVVRPNAVPSGTNVDILKAAPESSSSSDVEATEKPVIARGVDEYRGHMNGKEKLMSAGLAFSTLVLFIRAVYRVIELSDGWDGRVIHTQVYFNVLDGAMIVLSMYTINFLHPGFLLN